MPIFSEWSLVPSLSERGRVVRYESPTLFVPSTRWLASADVITALAHLPSARWFLSALIASELADDLRTGGPWTVLVPTDSAIARVGGGAFEHLFDPEEAEALIDLGEHHVARGTFPLLPYEPASIPTLVGATALVGAAELGVPGAAAVIRANLPCRNGVIHVLDDVLAPPWIKAHLGRERSSEGRDAA